MRQRTEIKTGAADHERRPILAAQLRQRHGRLGKPPAGRIVFAGIDMTVEPVRHAVFLLGRWPRRNNAQIAVNLHGIGVDDRSAELFGKLQRQR